VWIDQEEYSRLEEVSVYRPEEYSRLEEVSVERLGCVVNMSGVWIDLKCVVNMSGVWIDVKCVVNMSEGYTQNLH
jgi:hypothetical protein